MKKFFKLFYIVFTLFLFIGLPAKAQTVNQESLHITSVAQYELYPYYQQSDFAGQGYPGICILGSFYTPQQTQVAVRYTPFSSASASGWSFSQSAPVPPTLSGVNIGILSNLEPETEYVIQGLEVEDGNYFDITPGETLDNIRSICTPTEDGQISENCPQGQFVVQDCSPSGVNAAVQANGGSGVQIVNIQPSSSNIQFTVSAPLYVGDDLLVVYSSNQQPFIDANFVNLSNIPVQINTNGQTTVTIPNLSSQTTYYVTVLDLTQNILLTDASNQSYQSIETTEDDGNANTSGGGTISVNIGDFESVPELEGEEIQNGLVQCGDGDVYDCDFNALLATIDRVLKFLIYIIALPLAALLFAIAGIKLIIAKAQSKRDAMKDAKNLMSKVFQGLIFALVAWVLVKFVLVILGYNDPLVSQILDISLTD